MAPINSTARPTANKDLVPKRDKSKGGSSMDVLVVDWEGRKVIMERPTSLEDLLTFVREHFVLADNAELVVSIDTPDEFKHLGVDTVEVHESCYSFVDDADVVYVE
jgi:hypothetical protein